METILPAVLTLVGIWLALEMLVYLISAILEAFRGGGGGGGLRQPVKPIHAAPRRVYRPVIARAYTRLRAGA